MQRRIKDHLAERLHILAAVSHDLQTPIARMGLRAALLDDPVLREKLQGDLRAMQVLVEEGIAYARSAHGTTEPPRRIDLHALLDSLVCDYGDAGRAVRLTGRWDRPLTTRPESLRRIIGNLVDNALAFASDVEIAVEPETGERIAIAVRDRGPGIPPAELGAVLQPFHRLEGSRSRATGGTGLGLAIADQLTRGLGATLTLINRESGGLEVRVSLPANV
jgi:signal transduction histidine kinase